MLLSMIAALLAFTSCNSCSRDEAAKPKNVEVTIDNFLSVAKADFASEVKKSEKAVFYESQITFTNIITADTIGIERVMNVVQDTLVCVQFYHQNGNTYITRTQSWWLEDMPINLDNIISLDSAITRLQMADIVKPKSRLCTLRRILGPTPTAPAYIFGSMGTGFVQVNAITGAVSEIK